MNLQLGDRVFGPPTVNGPPITPCIRSLVRTLHHRHKHTHTHTHTHTHSRTYGVIGGPNLGTFGCRNWGTTLRLWCNWGPENPIVHNVYNKGDFGKE